MKLLLEPLVVWISLSSSAFPKTIRNSKTLLIFKSILVSIYIACYMSSFEGKTEMHILNLKEKNLILQLD